MNYQQAENGEMIPFQFKLSQNYPNPFKDKTIIKYCVPYKTRVQLKVFNSEMEMVDTLLDEIKDAGTYEIEFQSAVEKYQLTSGEFYYRLIAGDYSCEKKMEILE